MPFLTLGKRTAFAHHYVSETIAPFQVQWIPCFIIKYTWCLYTPYVCIYVYIGFKTFFYVVRHLDSIASYLPTGLHLGFLPFMAFFIPSIQFSFGLPRALFCFGIHFNAILGNLPSATLWTWPYHVSWFCSISFIIVSSSPIRCLIVTFLILVFLDILEDLLRASISIASNLLLRVLYTPYLY